jgi:hypothetical protein
MKNSKKLGKLKIRITTVTVAQLPKLKKQL